MSPKEGKSEERYGSGVLQMEMEKSIELDCPPLAPRPDAWIGKVVEGLGLEVKETTMRLFGCWKWEFPEVSDERWREIQPILKERITDLYNRGHIRYGSW